MKKLSERKECVEAAAKPDYKLEMKEFAKFATEYYCKGKLPYCFDSCNGFIDFTGYGEPIMYKTKQDFDKDKPTNLRFAWYCWIKAKQILRAAEEAEKEV